MDDAEAILAEVEQIIDEGHATQTLMRLFGITHRQATLALHQIRANLASSANRAGVPLPDFLYRLDRERKIAVFGFCTGAVLQRDTDLALDPETGERKHRPEYEI